VLILNFDAIPDRKSAASLAAGVIPGMVFCLVAQIAPEQYLQETVSISQNQKVQNQRFRCLPMKRRILLVDDEVAILLTLQAVLEINGFEVETAASGREAKLKIRNNQYHMVITDMRMERQSAGNDVVQAARKSPYRPAVALLTAFPLSDSDEAGRDADEVLVKPMNTNDLLLQIEALLVTHEDKKRREEELDGQAVSAEPKASAAKRIAGPKKSIGKKSAKRAAPMTGKLAGAH
jgi:DNA-binding NtrC family response regulator